MISVAFTYSHNTFIITRICISCRDINTIPEARNIFTYDHSIKTFIHIIIGDKYEINSLSKYLIK